MNSSFVITLSCRRSLLAWRSPYGLLRGGRQDLGQPHAPKREALFHLRSHHCTRKPPRHATGQLVFDLVCHHGSFLVFTRLGPDTVAMTEDLERPLELLIDEVAVPGEIHDFGQPAGALRDPDNRAKADKNLRSHSGGNTAKPA